MPKCTKCHHELVDGAKFCFECGAPTGYTAPSVSSNVESGFNERTTIYDGEIHKCPNCGEVLSALSVSCPTCGYELRGKKSSRSIREFAQKMEEIEQTRENKRNIFANMFPPGNISKTDDLKVNLIRSFAIPNTKEDIYEFLILASSNINVKLYGMFYDESQFQGMMVASQREISDAWLTKFEQAYQKAQLLFAGTDEFEDIKRIYFQKQNEIKRKKMQLPMICIGVVLLLGLVFGVIFLVLGLTGKL